MRDAWLRCMDAALDDPSIDADTRGYLQRRFLEVASHDPVQVAVELGAVRSP